MIRYAIAFAVAGYAAVQIADLRNAFTVLAWFAGAIVLHDFVLYPLYTAADRALQRAPLNVNYVRVPAILSGLLLLAWFPLILERRPELYRSIAGVDPPDYLARWLLVTAALFGASLLVALLHRAAQARARRAAAPEDRV